MRYFILILLLGIFSEGIAQNSKHKNLDSGLAIQGYDPVAYFANKAIEGDANFSATFQGAVYYFSTIENKKLFESNPSKYEPQYGGWCAFAMGENGEKVEVNPQTFKIVDGKLYLFYNAFFNNTLKSWNKDENNLKVKADLNWKNITKNR